MTLQTIDQQAEIALLHEKVDRLTALLEAQERRQQAFEELKQDMIPIVNNAIKLSIEELAEIGTEFKLEDLLCQANLFHPNLRTTITNVTNPPQDAIIQGMGIQRRDHITGLAG